MANKIRWAHKSLQGLYNSGEFEKFTGLVKFAGIIQFAGVVKFFGFVMFPKLV